MRKLWWCAVRTLQLWQFIAAPPSSPLPWRFFDDSIKGIPFV
jgi:hypothetical protein